MADKPEQVLAGELPAWEVANLPKPPAYSFRSVIRLIGPGAILLSVSIGSGEWLIGPATVAKYGATLLWITAVSVLLQVTLNLELIRYTLYTGEPIYAGFMRTKPGPTFWGWFYVVCGWLQLGWPAWALAAATAITAAQLGRLPGRADQGMVLFWGYITFLLCVLILAVGDRVERTLEKVSWFLIIWIIGYLLFIGLFLIPAESWGKLLSGYVGLSNGHFKLLPEGGDWLLLGAFAAYSGAGGVVNGNISNWFRDKGFGMSAHVGYIPSAVGGRAVKLSHVGKVFKPTPENLEHWREWWTFARTDQCWLWAGGCLFGMGLPALLVIQFVEPGSDLGGWAVAAHIADAVSQALGRPFWHLTLLCGIWILFGTQLGIMDGLVRMATDNLWMGSQRVRAGRGGDVRAIYYSILIAFALWGALAINFAPPLFLLKLSANIAGLILVVMAIHVIVVNRKFLPKELRPPVWREAVLVLNALFFGSFAVMLLLHPKF